MNGNQQKIERKQDQRHKVRVVKLVQEITTRVHGMKNIYKHGEGKMSVNP